MKQINKKMIWKIKCFKINKKMQRETILIRSIVK